ncbi:MAG: hypothetical protein ACLPT6_06030 [Desulfobaccales bacterium]
MTRIRSLYDAIRTKIKEDQCTNLLFWLLKKTPSKVLLDILIESGLSIDTIDDNIDFLVQYPLKNSRADAKIDLSDNCWLIVEVKRLANFFYKEQFINHLKGARQEFGNDNTYFLFISGDNNIPNELETIITKNGDKGKIGFISWRKIFDLLNSYKYDFAEKYKIIIDEFLTFAKHYNLWRIMPMNKQDLQEFLSSYNVVYKYKDTVLEICEDFIMSLKNRIIIESNELIEENKGDTSEEFPCLIKSLFIDGWHLKKRESSAYIFIDVLNHRLGIVLNGYQDSKDKAEFLTLWNNKYKFIYEKDPRLNSFAWDDEYNVFRIIEGTTSKIFNPEKVSEFEDYFYWGYCYDLDFEKLKLYLDSISNDFKALLKDFRTSK